MALQLPWIIAGGTPCCCPCGWEEFGTPSDPPVYYKTKTTAGTYSWANSGTNPDANCTSLLVSGSFTLVETKEVNEAASSPGIFSLSLKSVSTPLNKNRAGTLWMRRWIDPGAN